MNHTFSRTRQTASSRGASRHWASNLMEDVLRPTVSGLSATWSNMHFFCELMLQEFNTFQPKILYTQQAFLDFLEACTTKAPTLTALGVMPLPQAPYVQGVNNPYWNRQGGQLDLAELRHAVARVRTQLYYGVLNTEYVENPFYAPGAAIPLPTMVFQPPTPLALAAIMFHAMPGFGMVPNVFDEANPDLNNEGLYPWNNGNAMHAGLGNVMNRELFRYAARRALCDARNLNATAYRPAVVTLVTFLVSQIIPPPGVLQSIQIINAVVPSLIPPFPVVPAALPLPAVAMLAFTAAIDFHRLRLEDMNWGGVVNQFNYQLRIRQGIQDDLNENILGFRM
jgi:hypothetical protein